MIGKELASEVREARVLIALAARIASSGDMNYAEKSSVIFSPKISGRIHEIVKPLGIKINFSGDGDDYDDTTAYVASMADVDRILGVIEARW